MSGLWTHRGWTYEYVDDSDNERHSCFHMAVCANETRLLSWSAHKNYTPRHFQRYIDLGFPKGSAGNVYPEEIDAIWDDLLAKGAASQARLIARGAAVQKRMLERAAAVQRRELDRGARHA